MFATFLGPLTLALPPAEPPVSVVQDDEVVHELLQDFPGRWQRAVDGMAIPGMSVVVVMDDEIALLQCFGLRDTEKGLPVTPDTAFYIASATKPFVALALCALADEGKVDLDAPVKEYLPRFELADAAATDTVTVRDLLSHAQGINMGPIVLLDAYTGEITEDRYYHFLAKATPVGSTVYTNVHFTLAGRVVEAVAGRPWREDLAARIFEPAGMTRTTGYADEMYSREDVAIPTVWEAGAHRPAPVRKTDRTMHAAGGLGTSARDVAQWIRLNLNAGQIDGKRILSADRAKEMQTLQSELAGGRGSSFVDQGYGLGWKVTTFQGQIAMQHGGGYVGSSSLISFLPEVGVGVGVLVNTDVGGNALCQLVTADVFDRLLGGDAPDALASLLEQARSQRSPAPEPEARENPAAGDGLSLPPNAYVGDYSNEHLGTFRVGLQEGELTAHLGQMAFELSRVAPDAFEARSAGFQNEGRFMVEGRVVTGVAFDVMGETYLFAK